MNLEGIGIAALCVSQGMMWIRNAQLQREAFKRNDAAHTLLQAIKARAAEAAHFSESVDLAASPWIARLERHSSRHAETLVAFGEAVTRQLEALRATQPKRRNRRAANPDAPIGLIPTTIAPLEAGKRPAPAKDPIGPVSS